MQIKPVHWITLGLALSLGVAVCDGFRVRDRYSVAVGRYEEALKTAKVDNAIKDKELKAQAATIAQKDKLIAEKNEAIGHITNTIGQKDTDLKALGQKLKQLETSGDLSAQVANLKEQIIVWSSKFSLAQGIIAEKDAIIASWTAKFDAQVTISETWKAKYESELHLRTLAEKGWKATENRLRWTRIVGNVKTGAVLVAAGYIIFNALKGT